jgi:glycosyltransferase involved in cell wall biosynthesis
MKTLLVVPSVVKFGKEEEVADDRHPTMDYTALAATLRATPGDQADLLDYADVDRETDRKVGWVRKYAGRDAALALMAFQRRHQYDVIFTNSESVSVPLALLLKTARSRPRHVTIGHHLSTEKKHPFFRWLNVQREIDTIFVYASRQLEFARDYLGIPAAQLRLIPFHADHRFYRPLAQVPARENQICAAGLEWRDYPTLIDAVSDMTELSVRLAAASPWSKHGNETEARVLPPHVQARRYDYRELRELYAESAFVVVPLYDNDFQAGITTILEAMAMGKAVIVTSTQGQNDVIVDGQNGLYVPPGSVEGWRNAIERLRNDPALRARLGQRARRWIEDNATLDHWVEHIVAALQDRPAPAKHAAPEIAA